MFSKNLVERKRLDRTLPAIINGLSATQARSQGLIDDISDADKSTTSSHETLFVTGESDEETERVIQVSHATTTETPKPDPSSLTIPSAVSPAFPNLFSSVKPTPIGLTSAHKTQPGEVFPVSSGKNSSSFGKPSSYAISTPTLLPDAPANTADFKPQPILQDNSKILGKLNTDPGPSTGGTPVFKFVESSQNAAVSSPEPENLPNDIPEPTSENKPVHTNIAEATEPAAKIQSQAPAERNLRHPELLSYSTPFTFDPYNQDVSPIPSKPHLPLEEPKVLQGFSATGGTSLSSHDTSPISMSFASNQKLAATGNGTTVTGSSVDPRHSLTTKFTNISQPSVSLAARQANSFPTVTSIQESSTTDFRLLKQNLPLPGIDTTLDTNSEVRQGSAARTDLKGILPTNKIHLDQRSIMLSTISDGIMHNDGALLQQFVEYVIGPIIIDSVRETRDRRSWKQASQ